MSETDAYVAPEATKPEAQPGPLLPVCPYCGLDPCVPEMLSANFGMLIGRIFICPSRACRKLFNVELIAERKSPVAIR
jgi:hypothetical protein